jgi:oxygen-dependent protoporphyrinogen oxidase
MHDNDLVILGGGITALSFAYYIKKYKPKCHFKILIDQPKSGGVVLSEISNNIVFEWGPRGIRPSGKGQQVLELVEELGLWDQLVFADSKAKKRYIYINTELHLIPYNLRTFIKSPFLKIFRKAFIKDLRSKKRPISDESIASFMDRHFGKEFRQVFIDSMVSGIWAGNIEEMSVSACFPSLKYAEKSKYSVIKGMLRINNSSPDYKLYENRIRKKALFSFKSGIQTLTNRLTEELKDHIMYNHEVLSIQSNSKVKTITNKGDFISDKCVSTLPAYIMKNITEKPLSKFLKTIEYAPLALVNMVVPKKEMEFDGFGFLVPSKESSPVLGMVANSNIFEEHCPAHKVSCTFIIGGARYSFEELKKIDYKSMVLTWMKDVFKFQGKPLDIRSKIINNAIPQYKVGHLDIVSSIENRSDNNVILLGNYLYGVSMVDIICKSKALAQSISL